jgi:hypothetical protein
MQNHPKRQAHQLAAETDRARLDNPSFGELIDTLAEVMDYITALGMMTADLNEPQAAAVLRITLDADNKLKAANSIIEQLQGKHQ